MWAGAWLCHRAFTLQLYECAPCSLEMRGGRKHAKDLTNEILSYLQLWENGDIASLWSSAVAATLTRAVLAVTLAWTQLLQS